MADALGEDTPPLAGPAPEEQAEAANPNEINPPVYADIDSNVTLRRQGDRIAGSFKILNIMNPPNPILYKVKSLHPDNFHVNPIIGKIGPNATGRVYVQVIPGTNITPDFRSRFLVRIIPLEDEPVAETDKRFYNFGLLNEYYKELEGNANPQKHYMLVTFDLDEPQVPVQPPLAGPSVRQRPLAPPVNVEPDYEDIQPSPENSNTLFRKCMDRWPYIVGFLLILIFAILWYQDYSTNIDNENSNSTRNATTNDEVNNQNTKAKLDRIIKPCIGDII